jgi:hypothetical protein
MRAMISLVSLGVIITGRWAVAAGLFAGVSERAARFLAAATLAVVAALFFLITVVQVNLDNSDVKVMAACPARAVKN